VLLRADGTKLFPPFLRWLVRGPHWWEQVGTFINVGAVFDSLKCADIPNFKMPLPPLPEQKAIAHILGTLDDKIELNRRMNATLEAMARALFQNWFVDFDPVRAKLDGRQPAGLDEATAALFPAHFQDSDVGHVPAGWEVGQLGKYLETEIGGDWGEDDRFDGSIEVVALRGVDLEHLRQRGDANPPRRWVKESSLAMRRMSHRNVLVASSGAGPCGRALWVNPYLEAAFPVPVLYSNFCKRYRAATPAHALYFDRILFEMRESGEIWDFINGTSLPNLDSNGLMMGKIVLVPPVAVLEKFAAFVQPIYERLYSRESRILATLRDTLLPKLLSGEIPLATLEKLL
jgi:type I restriction enzyme, S subunit